MIGNKTNAMSIQSIYCKRLLWVIIFNILVLLPMLYVYGPQQVYTSEKTPLKSIFKNIFSRKQYKNITNTITSPQISRVIIQGQLPYCMSRFLQHIADELLHHNIKVIFMDYSKQTTNFFSKVNLYFKSFEIFQSNAYCAKIITGVNKYSLKELNDLLQQKPLDKYIIVLDNTTSNYLEMRQQLKNISEWLQISFPTVNETILLKKLAKQYDVSLLLVQHIAKEYSNFPQFLKDIQANYKLLDNERYLGEQYFFIDDLNKKTLKTLREKCEKNITSIRKISEQLRKIGIVQINGVLFWENVKNKLNYDIQAKRPCQYIQVLINY